MKIKDLKLNIEYDYCPITKTASKLLKIYNSDNSYEYKRFEYAINSNFSEPYEEME